MRQLMSASGAKRASQAIRSMSVFGGKADLAADIAKCPLLTQYAACYSDE